MPPPSKAGGASPWNASSLFGAANQSATIEGLVQQIATLENKVNALQNVAEKMQSRLDAWSWDDTGKS
jgi:hypothetical protein